MSSFCRKCGIRLREGAAFCPKCGEVTRNGLANKNVDTKTVASKLVGNLVASSEPGMSFVDMGTLGFGEIINTYNLTGHIGGITGNAQAILSPFRTFTSVISRAGAGLRNIKKRPAALIPVIGLIIVWLSLFTFRHSGSEESFFTDLLSFASFGWGSPDRSPVGAIGTSIGMGTVSAFFVSLFSGGISRFGDGIRKLKDKSVISSGKGWSVVGAGASLIIYTFITGVPSVSHMMAGVSALFISIQSYGNEHSWLYQLARSITSTKDPANGIRTANSGAVKKLMAGNVTGNLIMTAYAFLCSVVKLGTNDASVLSLLIKFPLTVGIILLVIGSIIVISAGKAANPGQKPDNKVRR